MAEGQHLVIQLLERLSPWCKRFFYLFLLYLAGCVIYYLFIGPDLLGRSLHDKTWDPLINEIYIRVLGAFFVCAVLYLVVDICRWQPPETSKSNEQQESSRWGIRDVQERWVSNNAQIEFIKNSKDLRILLKDGHTFFANKDLRNALVARLSEINNVTQLLMVHPESKNLAAVEDMDSDKKNQPGGQKGDCLGAIEAMKSIREEIRRRHNYDIASNPQVKFFGYDQVPTWHGFISDEEARISLYMTRPHRGKLPSLCIKSHESPGGSPALLFEIYKTDFDELMRHVTLKSNPHHVELWNFFRDDK